MVSDINRQEVIREEAIQAQTPSIQGQVTKVEVREPGDGLTNVTANVITRNTDRELRRRPVLISDHEGHMVVPEVDDWVYLDMLGKRGQGAVITSFVHTEEQPPPYVREGHWRHEFRRDGADPLYLEAEPVDHSAGDPEVVRMGVKPDGVSDPTTEVAVDNSGTTTEVRIETDGDITLSAGGNIVIEEGGTTKSVLTEDAVFEYDDTTVSDTSDGTGSSSTTTKTTSTVSNGETTDVEMD